jgi:signal transduction histidine kinase
LYEIRRKHHILYYQISSNKKTLIESIDSVQFSADLKNIQITCQKSTNWDINVIHNYDWTREVFINVLENAIKYSDINSEISINISKTELYVIISISDHGIGIKEQNLSKIFQRFYRCPEVYHLNGNGIGLYLSRLILEKENGYITVESIYEKGSTFNIWLPTFFN